MASFSVWWARPTVLPLSTSDQAKVGGHLGREEAWLCGLRRGHQKLWGEADQAHALLGGKQVLPGSRTRILATSRSPGLSWELSLPLWQAGQPGGGAGCSFELPCVPLC